MTSQIPNITNLIEDNTEEEEDDVEDLVDDHLGSPAPPHLGSQVDTGRRVVAVQVKVHNHRRGHPGIQLGPTQPQPAQEAQHQQHGAVDSQERGGQHGVAAPVSHHPNDTGPHQQGKNVFWWHNLLGQRQLVEVQSQQVSATEDCHHHAQGAEE
ncbi:hypothetical protein EYF80_029475 [Liparis tanakae]|uniref:Uncharacterized protein n=1 Tax=Liparis tanakae TaxID=230148 RepID=A0A4Z2H4D1_9TELE|nr:hypothetical protein EYF80_029475 [Liparis tanakae]